MPLRCPLNANTIETVDCGTFIREKVQYDLEAGDTATAYLLLPKGGKPPYPAVYCYHQHTSERIGKDELVGVAGNPDLAYAKELAERGYVTLAPDAITFGARRVDGDPTGYAYWEMVTRLVQGKTLLGKVLHDVFVGLDYLQSRQEVNKSAIGFIGHSYGGRMAIWSAALDDRIKATVSNCGCISYKHSLTEDTGVQMEFVVQNIAQHLDIEDLIKLIEPNHLLISATEEDKWCRGVTDVYEMSKPHFNQGHLTLRMYPGGHQFTKEMRENAYQFLDVHLKNQ